MSTHKTKEELTRLAWITELRRQGHRQCHKHYREAGGFVCAIGLLADIAGLDTLLHGSSDDIAAHAGLSGDQAVEIVLRNDGGGRGARFGVSALGPFQKHTFAEIADVIEGWFHAPQ